MSDTEKATPDDREAWDAFQSVYEPGSRVSFEFAERNQPYDIDSARAVARWTYKAGRLAALEEAEKALPKVEWPDRHPDPEAGYRDGFMDGQTRMAWDCARAIRLLRSSSPEGDTQ